MTRRLDKTLGDYIGIALSPVLIMTLIGSLIYFLLAIAYRGGYPGRVHLVFALFVMGAVLVGRIAIEEGKERAHMFAAPLALVALVAINRFTDLGLIGSVLLVALIWWCAQKLTWDCTLIDEAEDASGEGLMQTVGLEEKAANVGQPSRLATQPSQPSDRRDACPTNRAEEPEGVTSREAKPATWWERFVERQRRPHAPGVWVVYFSLAALPLFGLGQLFIPKSDAASRRYAFLLLVVYVASGLGLLLSTSFLGLRRYLRQRHLQMPPAMAGLWIAIGCVLIVALLVVAALLPRPGAELEIALPFTVGSHDRPSSPYAVMRSDPAQEDRGGPRSPAPDDTRQTPPHEDGQQVATRETAGQEIAGQEIATQGTSSQADASRSGPGSEKKPPSAGSQEQDGGSQGDSGNKKGGPKSPRSGEEKQASSCATQSDEKSGEKPRKEAREESGESRTDAKAGAKPEERHQGEKGQEAEKGQDSRMTPDSQAHQQGEAPNSQQDRSGTRSESQPAPDRGGSQPDRPPPRQSEPESSGSSGWRETERRSEGPEQTDREQASSQSGEQPPGSATQPDRQPWLDPGAVVRGLGQSFATIFKWIVIAVLLGIIGVWLWRHWAEVLKGLQDFLTGWREFWARLFGAKAAGAEQAAAAEAGPGRPRARPFADFPDPFATGDADRWAPDELVRYSFDALEAWAREHGWPRSPDETPHEFAQELGTRVNALAEDLRRLADLYCRVAYAPGTLARRSTAPLRHLWQQLRYREPVSMSGE